LVVGRGERGIWEGRAAAKEGVMAGIVQPIYVVRHNE
jgi:hypothetical protein